MSTFNKLSGFNKLDTLHKDLIHDISFNYYGSMLATCSSDQTIKIWKCIDNESWELFQEINHIDHTHKASIQMTTWANPIFGSIFATCSTDKKINIFQLCECEQKQQHNKYKNIHHKKSQKFLFQRVFLEFHDAISISFVPPHLGLKLSIVCNDGIIKILTARDITNLSQWNQQYSININDDFKTKSYSMSWNESKWEIPSFAVGANRNRVFIYKYFDDKNQIEPDSKDNDDDNDQNKRLALCLKIEIPNKNKQFLMFVVFHGVIIWEENII